MVGIYTADDAIKLLMAGMRISFIQQVVHDSGWETVDFYYLQFNPSKMVVHEMYCWREPDNDDAMYSHEIEYPINNKLRERLTGFLTDEGTEQTVHESID